MGARNEIIRELKTFSPSAVDAEKLWNAMTRKPAIKCLCEAQETKYKGPFSEMVWFLLVLGDASGY
jgi:hypothetical protein